MKRDEAKAQHARAAEEMFDERWAWGEERPQPTLDEMAGKAALRRPEFIG